MYRSFVASPTLVVEAFTESSNVVLVSSTPLFSFFHLC